jgi:hypothetical protein
MNGITHTNKQRLDTPCPPSFLYYLFFKYYLYFFLFVFHKTKLVSRVFMYNNNVFFPKNIKTDYFFVKQ